MTQTYKDAMDAIHILAAAETRIARVDGPDLVSPAWLTVHHAIQYVACAARSEMT